MFNPRVYENSRPDGIGVLEILNGTGSCRKKPRRFVPLKRTELKGKVLGPLASLCLTMVYRYSKEQCDKVVEAVYRFPLPGDAAVTGVRIRFGDVEILTELKERTKAEAEYKAAKRQGKQAALATRESPDVFSLHVAGIQPDQDVTVETSYVQLARSEGPGWSLRIPLTTAPRYVRSDEATSRHAHGQPLLLLRDPRHRFSLNVTLRGAGAAESSTHRLDVNHAGDGLSVHLRDGEIVPDRDCVLSWRPRQDQGRPMLQVLIHDDPASGHVYFLAFVAPPALGDSPRGLPRDVVLLVDHSGSMEGPKWEAADWAVKRFLADLTDRDALALGLFHTTTRWSSKVPRKAEPDVVKEAIRFLEEGRDSGGTELGVALEQALSLERPKGEHARHVLIVTDAQVTDEGRILRLADEEAGRPDRRRISVLCIDAAPNSFLAHDLAERGGGMARFLTSAPEEEDIATALDEVLQDWAAPVLAGLRLEVNRSACLAAGREVLGTGATGWSAVDLGDLPAGRTVWVAGRVPRSGSPELLFRLTCAGNREVAASAASLGREGSECHALKALFGAQRILGSEFLIHSGCSGEALADRLGRLGYDPEQVPLGKPPEIYAENVRAHAHKALRRLLVREALGYGLACSETAFVAVRTEAGKPVEGTVPVANALPAGWSRDFLSGPVMTARLAVAQRMLPAYASLSPAAAPSGMPLPSAPAVVSPSAGAEKVKSAVVFSGVPRFGDGEAVLFDSSQAADAKTLPNQATICRLEIRFLGGALDPRTLDPGLSLLVFVDDTASPRARVRLVDVMRQGGERPLNLLKLRGRLVRMVVLDPAGAWARGAPEIQVALGWHGAEG